MVEHRLIRQDGFASLLGLLLVVVIVCILLFNTYFKESPTTQSPAVDQENQALLESHGVNTASTQSVLESTLDQIGDIEDQIKNREGTIFDSVAEQF